VIRAGVARPTLTQADRAAPRLLRTANLSIQPLVVESPSGVGDMSALSSAEVSSRLGALTGWRVENGELVRTFQFKDFVAAMQFVNRVADLAEQAGHHPDIDIRYNRVRLGLVTHDAGGLTAKDFDLASKADQAAQPG
jgi:4a-hydroxytetrahydrobiopterin dehydratase